MNSFSELKSIFQIFFLVGSSSFGGYSAMIAVVQKILVDKKKLLKESVIIEGFSLASLLPGPVAVNTVTYIGFNLAYWTGAMVAMIAVILPSMIFMLILAVAYEKVGMVSEVGAFLKGVIPVIMALIFSVIWKMSKSSFEHWVQYLVFVIALGLQIVLSGYWVFLAAIVFGAIVGVITFGDKAKPGLRLRNIHFKWYHQVILITLMLTLVPNFLDLEAAPRLLQLFSVFSGVSLTLFGGGYVMIPLLEELVVGKFAWLTAAEFIDAIVLGQATPGPILISATFIGYKVAGFAGAIISTLAIFTPSALLITLLADLFGHGDKAAWQPVIKGIKPVVLGLMTYSIWILMNGFESYSFPILAGIVAAFVLIRFQVHFLWLILAFGIFGIWFFRA